MQDQKQSADELARRLENIKGRLGNESKNLGPEIDQIAAAVRALGGSGTPAQSQRAGQGGEQRA